MFTAPRLAVKPHSAAGLSLAGGLLASKDAVSFNLSPLRSE
jgi:hypothetical protein